MIFQNSTDLVNYGLNLKIEDDNVKKTVLTEEF